MDASAPIILEFSKWALSREMCISIMTNGLKCN